MSPFDEIKGLLTQEKFNITSPYMINKLLSFIPETILISVETNRYIGLPKWAVNGLLNSIPKRKNIPFINFIKFKKRESNKLEQKISTALCCSNAHAIQTIELLRKMGYKPEQAFGLKEGE